MQVCKELVVMSSPEQYHAVTHAIKRRSHHWYEGRCFVYKDPWWKCIL